MFTAIMVRTSPVESRPSYEFASKRRLKGKAMSGYVRWKTDCGIR
jgi:hypothetical protein